MKLKQEAEPEIDLIDKEGLKQKLAIYQKTEELAEEKEIRIDTKKNLLVTLANKKYIKQAKQLLSSVYWNAGWKGDYMLLAHEIPEKELEWFRSKGILVKNCESPYKKKLWSSEHPLIVLNKFHLFTPEFKKWGKIIYLDADIIIRASLNDMLKTKVFSAPKAQCLSLKKQFVNKDREIYKKLLNHYTLKGQSFNTGIFVFNTDIIEKETFSSITNLLSKFGELSYYAEEPILNLYFYKKWKKLPIVYNIYPNVLEKRDKIKPERIKGIILHFIHLPKPWTPKSHFYKEWQHNLKRADSINLKKIQPSEVWSEKKILKYVSYLGFKRISRWLNNFPKKIILGPINLIKRILGIVGIIIKKQDPSFYFKLKKLKRNLGIKRILGKVGIIIKKQNQSLYFKLKKLKRNLEDEESKKEV